MATLTEQSYVSIPESLRWLWKYWRTLKARIALLVVLTPIAVFFSAYTPLLIAQIFDELTRTQASAELIRQKAMWVLIFSLIHLILFIGIQSLRGETNARLENDFRMHLFRILVHLGERFYMRFKTGDIVTRLIDDVGEKLSWFACSGIFRLYEGLLRLTGCLYFMSQLSLRLTLFTLLPLALVVYLYILASQKTMVYSLRTQQAISALNSLLTQAFDGIRFLRAYGQEERQAQAFDQAVSHQRQSEIALVRISSLMELSYSTLSEMVVVLVFLFGGWLYFQQQITLGTLVAFNSYIFMLIWPLVDIGQFFIKGRTAGVSIHRIREVEALAPARPTPGGQPAFPASPSLEFRQVCFSYGAIRPVLQDISFAVSPGETVAFVGAVGSGKSTLLSLLPRLLEAQQGDILLNGARLDHFDLASLRSQIGFVSQTPSLFSDTLGHNIRFGRQELSDEQIASAIRVAQLQKDMQLFPAGLETPIGQRGVKVSGGQKQRIAIARALANQPRILILDDCTSALDARTEADFWAALPSFSPGMTIFLVTHRLGTLQRADRIVVLHDGRIVASGTHAELLQNSPVYRSLYLI